jgi:hypothetical protein
MSEIKTGGPAFPLVREWAAGPWEHEAGMTLRDYFAAKAMQGLLQHTAESTHQLASESYDIADAMLKAREME